jgi:hypothetical protein
MVHLQKIGHKKAQKKQKAQSYKTAAPQHRSRQSSTAGTESVSSCAFLCLFVATTNT